MPTGGQIRIEARKEDGVVRLSVSDTGKGIAPEKQSNMFDAFRAGDTRGAGLGLALVRHFVDLHGGYVMMKSAQGAGTTVICHLPEAASPNAPRAELELGPGAVAA
jgi:signal transduction histidine kinase